MTVGAVRSPLLIALTLLALPGARLDAQELPPLPLGARVRVSVARGALPGLAERERVTGTLMRLPPDSLVVYDDALLASVAVHHNVIRQLELSRGVHGHAGGGALIGLAVGLVGGVATGLLLCSGGDCVDDDGNWTATVAGLLGLGGAAAGTGIGALTGALIRHEGWTRVPITPAGRR